MLEIITPQPTDVPGTTPQMAAVLACGSVPMTLTLCPLSLQPAQPQDPMTV